MALYVDGLYTKCSSTQTGAIRIPDLKENKFLMGGYSYAPPDAGADPATLTGQVLICTDGVAQLEFARAERLFLNINQRVLILILLLLLLRL